MTNILLATSNGTGMGHLTRQAAVALSLGQEHEPTIFSLSVGLPLVESLGLRGEYCPSYEQPWIASKDWHAYLAERIVTIVRETESDAVLFDGVAPYPGLARASRQLRDVAFIWLRRGMWKDANQGALRKGEFFDLVIEPGDLARQADIGPTAQLGDAVEVGPISILEPLQLMDRAQARQILELPADDRIALVTLGSGRLGDVAGPGRVALETLLDEDPTLHVAVTTSPVALNEIPTEHAGRVTPITGVYPLAIYLAAFDLAVSSAGYNAVHELLPAGLPTLLVANTATRTDDQLRRASYLEESGLALAVADDESRDHAQKLKMLLDADLSNELAMRAKATHGDMTGAGETGSRVVQFASGFDRRRRSMGGAIRDGERVAIERLKDFAKSALGEDGTERLKAILGRSPGPTHTRTKVKIVERPQAQKAEEPYNLALLRSVTTDDLRRRQPVEHIVADASEEYVAARRAVIKRYYDVLAG